MDYLNRNKRLLRHLIVAMVIWPMIVPIVFMDVGVEIYHRVSFPIYGKSYVSRKKYIKIDRYKLSYLNPLQKIYCAYCGYANGAIRYWTEIVGITEKYWCGIMHQEEDDFVSPAHHAGFVKFGDKKACKLAYSRKKRKKK